MAKKELKLKAAEKSQLSPEVRSILSLGCDYFDELSHMEPIPRDRWGKIKTSFWTHAGQFERTEYDPPANAPDARNDFLRAQWAAHKSEVMAYHLNKFKDGSRPWGFWMWSAPEQCPRQDINDIGSARWKVACFAVLLRHNSISPEEQEAIRRRDVEFAALRSKSEPEEK